MTFLMPSLVLCFDIIWFHQYNDIIYLLYVWVTTQTDDLIDIKIGIILFKRRLSLYSACLQGPRVCTKNYNISNVKEWADDFLQ